MEQFTATTPIAHNFSEVAAIKEPVPIEERDDVTVDELERLWESLPYPAELYNGRIVYKMANFAHGMIRTNVAGVIGDYLESHSIGLAVLGVNFRLGDNRSKESRIPDVCFISKMVWVIFAYTHEVLVCTATGKHFVRDLLTAPEVLPEFKIPIQEIFEGIET